MHATVHTEEEHLVAILHLEGDAGILISGLAGCLEVTRRTSPQASARGLIGKTVDQNEFVAFRCGYSYRMDRAFARATSASSTEFRSWFRTNGANYVAL